MIQRSLKFDTFGLDYFSMHGGTISAIGHYQVALSIFIHELYNGNETIEMIDTISESNY